MRISASLCYTVRVGTKAQPAAIPQQRMYRAHMARQNACTCWMYASVRVAHNCAPTRFRHSVLCCFPRALALYYDAYLRRYVETWSSPQLHSIRFARRWPFPSTLCRIRAKLSDDEAHLTMYSSSMVYRCSYTQLNIFSQF